MTTHNALRAYDALHVYFTKLVNDNFLWQLIDFPTRKENILDLLLTNIPEKIINISGYDDVIIPITNSLTFKLTYKLSSASNHPNVLFTISKEQTRWH